MYVYHHVGSIPYTKSQTDIDQVDEEIGAAIKESGIPRSEIFVTTKFWPHFGDPENVELCLDICLKQMGLDYVDLYLAHVCISTYVFFDESY